MWTMVFWQRSRHFPTLTDWFFVKSNLKCFFSNQEKILMPSVIFQLSFMHNLKITANCIYITRLIIFYECFVNFSLIKLSRKAFSYAQKFLSHCCPLLFMTKNQATWICLHANTYTFDERQKKQIHASLQLENNKNNKTWILLESRSM